MRLSNIIKKQLLKNGYQYVESTRKEFALFYRYEQKKAYLIHLVEIDNTLIYDAARMLDTLHQAKGIFIQKGFTAVESFVLAVTDNIDKARDICLNCNAFWVMYVPENRLLIYEDQPGDFYGLRQLAEESLRKNQNYGPKDVIINLTDAIGPVTVSMAIINILVFIILSFKGSTLDAAFMLNHGAMIPESLYNGNWYQLITSMFSHFGIRHLASNMFVLCLLGSMLEKRVGKVSFFIIYILSGIGGNIISAAHNFSTGKYVISAGASGAVFGVMGALVSVVILNRGRLGNLTTQKIMIFVGLSLFQGFSSQGIDNLAHVGGVITGIIVAFLCMTVKKGIRKKYNERYNL